MAWNRCLLTMLDGICAGTYDAHNTAKTVEY